MNNTDYIGRWHRSIVFHSISFHFICISIFWLQGVERKRAMENWVIRVTVSVCWWASSGRCFVFCGLWFASNGEYFKLTHCMNRDVHEDYWISTHRILIFLRNGLDEICRNFFSKIVEIYTMIRTEDKSWKYMDFASLSCLYATITFEILFGSSFTVPNK